MVISPSVMTSRNTLHYQELCYGRTKSFRGHGHISKMLYVGRAIPSSVSGCKPQDAQLLTFFLETQFITLPCHCFFERIYCKNLFKIFINRWKQEWVWGETGKMGEGEREIQTSSFGMSRSQEQKAQHRTYSQ